MHQLNMFHVSGLGSLLIFALDIWAIVSIVTSTATSGSKVLWVLLVVFLPIVGFILWLFLGPRGKPRSV